ncbi:MAG: PLP-dependent aminotransferase family protein [Clostridiales bacterium]|nr:PLP-dependent aminotransferase family protein [Clostridiales bacterium]
MPIYEITGKNKYYTLYKDVREDILRGKFKSGEKLPAKRALAAELGVSVVTVQLAYEQLLAEGYVSSRERSGYFVENVNVQQPAADGNFSHRMPEYGGKTEYSIDFVKGSTPASLFPFSVWAKLMRGVLADCGEHLLERVPCDGDGDLKREIAAYLYRSRGIDVDPQYIVIGAGAEYLYGVIVQLLGRDKLFAVENPGYRTISGAYALNGAKTVPVAVIGTGISIDELHKSNADVLHISPAHQFPTGVITPAATRSQIIEWARERGRYIIEDDYDSEFRLSGKPLHSLYSLCPEKVIYMNTFSKSLAPSMRMGYMILPPALYAKFIGIFSSSANIVPLFEQKTLAAMLGGGYFERHINRLKNHYREIRRAVAETLEKLNTGCELYDTGGGLHMLVKFKGISDDTIKEYASAHGIRIRCLSDYMFAPLDGVEGCAVINYSGVTLSQLKELAEKFKR